MKNLFKIKSFDDEFKGIVIRHDMSSEQRTELGKMLVEAKHLQDSNNDSFLYRVRGEVGKWRIVRFRKREKD